MSVRLCICQCEQNTSFCQSAGGGIKSHSVTAVVDTGIINTLPHNSDLKRPLVRSLLKTLWEKEKMLFSPGCFQKICIADT